MPFATNNVAASAAASVTVSACNGGTAATSFLTPWSALASQQCQGADMAPRRERPPAMGPAGNPGVVATNAVSGQEEALNMASASCDSSLGMPPSTVLQDLLELHRAGVPVVWPDGLDADAARKAVAPSRKTGSIEPAMEACARPDTPPEPRAVTEKRVQNETSCEEAEALAALLELEASGLPVRRPKALVAS